MTALFDQKSQKIMADLIHDFELTDIQASGPLGNIGHECTGFTRLHEDGQPAGRGGYGWCQWTAARRVSFFVWCRRHGLDWHGDPANYGYLCEELRGDYKHVIPMLKRCKTVKAAVTVFEREFEQAGVVAMSSRLAWGRRALVAYRKGLTA